MTNKEPEDFETWAIRNTPYQLLDELKPSEIIFLFSEWYKNEVKHS